MSNVPEYSSGILQEPPFAAPILISLSIHAAKYDMADVIFFQQTCRPTILRRLIRLRLEGKKRIRAISFILSWPIYEAVT